MPSADASHNSTALTPQPTRSWSKLRVPRVNLLCARTPAPERRRFGVALSTLLYIVHIGHHPPRDRTTQVSSKPGRHTAHGLGAIAPLLRINATQQGAAETPGDGRRRRPAALFSM